MQMMLFVIQIVKAPPLTDAVHLRGGEFRPAAPTPVTAIHPVPRPLLLLRSCRHAFAAAAIAAAGGRGEEEDGAEEARVVQVAGVQAVCLHTCVLYT